MQSDMKCHPEPSAASPERSPGGFQKAESRDLIKIILFLIVLAVGGIIWFFGVWFGGEVATKSNKGNVILPGKFHKGFARGVTLKINLGDAKINYTTKIAKPILVFNLLEKAAKEKGFELEYKNYPGMGAFITKIGDKENGKSGKFWRYFVNSKYAQVGASSYLLKGGEVVEWVFN